MIDYMLGVDKDVRTLLFVGIGYKKNEQKSVKK
jgi:hypothetical protein